MVVKGSFGFIIGRKKRFMKVDDDADLLWRILVREIYVIMKHYGLRKDLVKEAFEKIKVAKGEPTISNIKKCQRFTDMTQTDQPVSWSNLLRFCQSSFINLLESGNILLKEENMNSDEYRFELDFNTWELRFYKSDKLIERSSLDEIMTFDEMPSKSYDNIVSEMNGQFIDYYDKVQQVYAELEKLYKLKDDAQNQGAVNIEDKLDKLIDDMKWEIKDLHMKRRVFYYRLKALDLIHL